MDIKQMRYLITLADTGNFTIAARDLSITQPSLSTFVSKVEGELGVLLFDRTTTPVSLTYAGKIYIDSLREIYDRAERLEQRMNDISGKLAGTLRVGLSAERAVGVIPRFLPVFKKRYPDIDIVTVEASSRDMMQMVREGKLDMAVLPLDGEVDDLTRNELYEMEMVLVDGCGFVKEEHLIEGMHDHVDPAKLEGLPLITKARNHGTRYYQDKLFRTHEVKANIVMEVPSNTAAFRLASAGMGVAIVPKELTEMIEAVGAIKVYHISVTGYRNITSVVTARNAHITGIERAFINCMRSVMNSRQYGEN